jgi:HK97 family phage portal protein
MAADELWELVAHHLLMWGNSFLLKDKDSLGITQMLWPIRPARMTVGRDTVAGRGRRYFQVDGLAKKYTEDDFIHIRGLSSDGLIGYSPIQQARQQLGNMLAQDEFQGRFWANGTFLGAALIHPGEMSDGAQQRLKKQLRSKRGVAEANGILVFEEDMKLESLGMPLRDAEFVAQQKLSRLAIAELFGLVPPHRWGSEDTNLTYANVGVAGSEFVRWTGRKWWKRIEKSLQRDVGLFPKAGPTLKVSFDTSDLERGDMKARFEAYKLGVEAHILTPNEARAEEGRPPLDGGDEFPEIKPSPAPPAKE